MSRVAVLSDIHGNADALRAVLADIAALGIAEIINLGDHFSGPLAAAETAQILREVPMQCLRGNHDRWMVEKPLKKMMLSDRQAHGQLSTAELDWLRDLPASLRLGAIYATHATPQDDVGYWLQEVSPEGQVGPRDLAAVEAMAMGIDAEVLLCGHTHVAAMARLSGGRLIVNPGSVGLPAYDDDSPVPHVMQSGTPRACYAVLEQGAEWRVDLRDVTYDPSRMIEMALAAGRPNWARGLEFGAL